MPTAEVALVISRIGLACQFAVTVLLVVLFALLRQNAQRRRYFLAWSYAWVALGLGLGGLFLRFFVFDLSPALDSLPGSPQRLFDAVYQFGKLAYLALLLEGLLNYAWGWRGRWLRAVGLGAAVVGALFTVFLTANLQQTVFWQVPLTVLAYLAGALIMLRLPRSRRSLGSRVTGFNLAFFAAVWLFNLWAFNPGLLGTPGSLAGELSQMSLYNAFIDMLLEMLLAFGMVLILLEDAKRDTEAAHTELALAHQELKEESLRDSLTRALNRRAFNEGAGLEAARAGYGTVIVFDLDNLKRVNDQYGHQAGDALLKYFVRLMRPQLRPTDKLYRFGGDEFLLVLPQAQCDESRRRFREFLGRAAPLHWAHSDASLNLAVSLGAASYSGGEGLEQAVNEADREMYAYKRQHKLFDS